MAAEIAEHLGIPEAKTFRELANKYKVSPKEEAYKKWSKTRDDSYLYES